MRGEVLEQLVKTIIQAGVNQTELAIGNLVAYEFSEQYACTMYTCTITIIDGINKFVSVSFDSATNRLRCIFPSLPNDVLKQCTVTYGINCDQQFSDLYSNASTGEFVTIPPLELMSDVTEYCFIVTASSNNLTATVRGMFFAIDTTKMNGEYNNVYTLTHCIIII